MKKIFTLTFIFSLFISLQLSAQLRENLDAYYEYTGPIINKNAPTVQSGLNDFFQNRVKMSHSYSMSFGSVAGSYQNVNAYTNTMHFLFTENLTGRLDVSFLHSPFGGSDFVDTNNGINGEIMIRNAELNYQINDNAHIRFQYQQIPGGYGYSPFRSGFGFDRYDRYDRFRPWY
ncbi:hypothetical protein [Gracilimonas mengyeensis]|uniref:Porin n=1 Tax=Gracilimonas mengyeensis TaxID=1302730 RepID=A0A521FIP7_9BACT|nr:hypothetical protein [Gracilimonas mengyeensis]SMO96083.1 hypothetical protein SAMN06265219_12010 [Gracilimonas mengyeensis]